MKITQMETIYQLAFMHRVFPVNTYIVEEEDSLTLVDAALPFCCSGILDIQKKIGKPIERVLLTHAHTDHMGAVKKLKEALPNLKVYISKRENRIFMGDLSLDPNEPQMPIKGGAPDNDGIKADILLDHQDSVGSLLAISVPGHTPGSMAFLDTRNNSLIVGDAFQTRGKVAVAGQFVPLFPFIGLATWSKKLAIESGESLLHYKPSLLATGHGTMLKNPLEAMKNSLLKAKTKS